MSIKILGVTGCPTGIAHTFMAEEALKKAAGELGCKIKVETNGAVGVENELTKKDIEEADAIIVACDKSIDMERFNGKPVIEVSVKDGVHKAHDLIQKCIDRKAPIRKGSNKDKSTNESESLSIGHTIYKHLMSGVSHMLPLVVAGGCLIAISFLWGIYSFDPSSDQYNQIAAMLNSVGGYSMGLMVPVLAAFIAQSIAGRPGMLAGFVGGVIADATGAGFLGGIIAGFLAGYIVSYMVISLKGLPRQLEGLKSVFIIPIITIGLVGIIMLILGHPFASINNSMMSFLENLQNTNPIVLGIVIGAMCAFDMGGPVNKAAYVTGTMLLGQGNYLFMAGVSAACITPPLVIAIASTISKNRFTEEDRTAGLVNYVLGSTHITEGAIPFAAKNPVKIIPILMLASSISAVLTYMFQIQVPAPHGGFLILGLVNKPLLWVMSIFVGSLVGAIFYILVTPKVEKITSKNITKEISLFQINTIKLNLKGKEKDEVINEMVDLLDKAKVLNNKELFKEEIYKREELSSTGIGMGIAIPHAKTKAVNTPRVAIGISKGGFKFDCEDDELAHIIFMIATKETDSDLHLKTISSLSGKLIHSEFIDSLLNAQSEKEILEKINIKFKEG